MEHPIGAEPPAQLRKKIERCYEAQAERKDHDTHTYYAERSRGDGSVADADGVAGVEDKDEDTGEAGENDGE